MLYSQHQGYSPLYHQYSEHFGKIQLKFTKHYVNFFVIQLQGTRQLLLDHGPSHLPSSHPPLSRPHSLPSLLYPHSLVLIEVTSPPAQAEQPLWLTIPTPLPAVMALLFQVPSVLLLQAISSGRLNQQRGTCIINQPGISYHPPPMIYTTTTPALVSYVAQGRQDLEEGLQVILLQLWLEIIYQTLIQCSPPLSDHIPHTHDCTILLYTCTSHSDFSIKMYSLFIKIILLNSSDN